jgi:hypothetical protein
MLKIWGRTTSSNVQKVLWLAGEIGLPYERIDAGGAFGVVDTPAYRAMNPNGLVPTIDDDVRRHFEPRAGSVAERLGALAAFRAAKVRTFAIVQPLLPGPIAPLADAGSVRVDVLSGVEGASAQFADPRWPYAADAGWQRDQAAALVAALRTRGVSLWTGELPPEL